MTGFRRFTLSLAAVCAFVFWLDAPAGLARGRAPQGGVHLTPNGYRVPVYGMSRVKAEDGTFANQCLRLSNQQIESTRFGRSVSRAMARWSPHATVHAAGDPSKATFGIIYTDAPGQGFNDSRDGAARKRALEASMAAWSQVLQGTIQIVIQARMEASDDPDSQLLASAGPVDLIGLEDIAFTTALASQMLGQDVRQELGNEADIEIKFSPDVNWDYSTNGAAPPDRVSFVYVTIHEIAHGLGFIDSFVSETGETLNSIPFAYDLFVNRGSSRVNPLTERGTDQIVNDLVSRGPLFRRGERGGGQREVDPSAADGPALRARSVRARFEHRPRRSGHLRRLPDRPDDAARLRLGHRQDRHPHARHHGRHGLRARARRGDRPRECDGGSREKGRSPEEVGPEIRDQRSANRPDPAIS